MSICSRVLKAVFMHHVTVLKGGFIQNATANAICGVGLSKTN